MKCLSLIVIGVLSAMLALAGCSSDKPPTTSALAMQGANVKLAEATTTISNSLTEVAAIKRATTPGLARKPLAEPYAPGLENLASVDWSGPVGPIVTQIANVSHYQLRTLGRPPALPVLVSIQAKNVPLGYILRDIDYQAGSKANIIVYGNTRTIELRYGR